MLRGFDSFRHELAERLRARGAGQSPRWPEFEYRLDAELEGLTGLLFEFYGERPDFAYWVENIVYGAFEAFMARPDWLKNRDRRFLPRVAGTSRRMS